jgi:pimeloyl-ACP methyl ester carboxylesterase
MFLHVNGIDLYYEIIGDGEPLLWLHGFMGCGHDWKFVFKQPPDGFQLIAPDLRGQGASVDLSGKFTFRQAAGDLLELLSYLNLRQIKAIGLSGGGIALLHMATMQPLSVQRMILVSVPPYFPDQARAFQRQFSEGMLPEIEKVRMRKRHKGGEQQIEQLFAISRRFADDHDDVNFPPTILSRVTAETLIVFGDRDPLYPVSLGIELYQAIPKSYLWVVPNGAHGPIFREAAAQFTHTAASFLQNGW